ncbi:MAG TPA: metallophosphoesterase [Gammaproteobacteria bacterium]
MPQLWFYSSSGVFSSGFTWSKKVKILLVHLSDIHIKSKSDGILSRAQLIAASIFSHLHQADVVFFVVSGDIAWSGLRDQYSEAKKFFSEIERHLLAERNVPIHWILAPGNHDCDFTAGMPSVRETVVNEIARSEGEQITDDKIKICTDVQSEFFDFRSEMSSGLEMSYGDRLLVRYKFNLNGKELTFDCLNVAWLSVRSEEQGKLYFPYERYAALASLDSSLRIAVMHHPLNWYGQATYHPFRRFLRGTYNLLLSGHEHQQGAGVNDDLFAGQSAYLEGGVLQSHDKDQLAGSSFNVVLIDTEDKLFKSDMFKWHSSRYISEDGGSSWADYRRLPEKSTNQFVVEASFMEILNDPGATFRHPTKQSLRLHDVFIYPDIRKRDDDSRGQKGILSSSTLRTVESIKNGLLLRGDEKYGKTSLLFQLFLHYHDLGMVPLYLNGASIDGASETDILKKVDRAVKEQYGAANVALFKQTSRDRKILLLDDIDQIRIPQKFQGAALSVLLRGYIGFIATSDQVFEISEIASSDFAALAKLWDQYEVLAFGHKLRYQLVKKWNALGDVRLTKLTESEKKNAKAEELLNKVIGKNYVPSAPIYLLTLLQSVESIKGNDLANSAFGHYYHYLIVQSLNEAAIKPDRLDELFHYCSQLAWFVKQGSLRELSHEDLQKFNLDFSEKYLAVDLGVRIEELIASKILSRRGSYYHFTYPYHFYFFLGRYLSENITREDIRAYIKHYCSHLYVREHANTILFLTHHSKDRFIYESIMTVLKDLFKDVNALDLETDTELLNALVNEAPKLVYHDGDVEKRQEEMRAAQDDYDAKHPIEKESNATEQVGKLELWAQLNLAVKTAEILGQILKNHYASIENPQKELMTDEIFSGSLKATRKILDELLARRELLISTMEGAIKKSEDSLKDEKLNDRAKRAMFNMLGLMTLAFICKTASCVNSEYIRGVVRKVAKNNGSNAYELIDIAVSLDFPGSIPFDDIRALKEENESNIFVKRLLQSLVIAHLYMFKTQDADKQRLCSILDIDISYQRMIDVRGKDVKKAKY